LFRRVGDDAPEALTRDNADYTAGREMPRQEAFRWSGPDGRQVEGLLFIPPESAGGGPRPCVVGLHGGPAESVRFGPGKDTDYATVLASRGFLVFRPNYRGSTGYGDEVYRDIVGRYFNHMPGDVLSGVEALVEQGLADPDRLAVMGYSAGGALTKKLVTMTDRFRAASAGAGASCWWTMYALGDLRVTRDHWFGGPPRFEDGDPGIWWDASPMRDVAKAKTPMLLFYGEEDRRNPWFEGALFHRALQDNGIECRLFLAPGQGHGDWKKSFHLAKANLEIEFFERLLNGREYDFEPAPGAGGADRQEGDRSP
ncbi:MAG: prolyl oligopeptidase family serine peptidase, partial [Candidatus Competibacterales bacterium]|nr:prolyl oligopeptidase family serine peptidase [Candidatus Competibacterales bacterium]